MAGHLEVVGGEKRRPPDRLDQLSHQLRRVDAWRAEMAAIRAGKDMGIVRPDQRALRYAAGECRDRSVRVANAGRPSLFSCRDTPPGFEFEKRWQVS